MFVIYIIMLVIIFLIGLYFYKFVNRNPLIEKIKKQSTFIKFIIIVSTIAILLLLLNTTNLFFVGIMHLFIYSLIMDLLMKIINKFCSKRKTNKIRKIYNTGIIPIFLAILTLIYGCWNMSNIIETSYTIYTDKNLSNEYKVLLISDLHFGVNMNSDKLKEYKNKFDNQNFDFVILAGDIVDETTTNSEMKNAFSILGNIKSKYGVFFVYGNHDKSNYRMGKREYTVEELEKTLDESNIITLIDVTYTINDEISLIGRYDASFTRENNRKTSKELLKDLDMEDFLFMIDHQPIDLEINSSLGYDLQVSGHTHGGQIFPVGILDNLLKINEMNYGHRKINDFSAIVSSGMAGWNYSFRTENHSEYVVINIKNK